MATSHESLTSRSRSPGRLTRLPPVRLASREELAAAARVAPLLRVARDLAAWAGPARPVTTAGELAAADAAAAAAALDLSAAETRAAWAVAIGTGMVAVSGNRAGPGTQFDVLTSGGPDDVLDVWCAALQAVLGQENLDGLATALYTAARPVRLDALFEAYAAAVGALTVSADDGMAVTAPADPRPPAVQAPAADQASAPADRRPPPRTRRRRRGQESARPFLRGWNRGWNQAWPCSPTSGWSSSGPRTRRRGRAHRHLVTDRRVGGTGPAQRARLAGPRAGEQRRRRRRGGARRAGRLRRRGRRGGDRRVARAAQPRAGRRGADRSRQPGIPGLRGAAFAVMDRVGAAAVPAVRRALANPVLRPHAAVWLREHGEEATLSRADSAWLLVDLGAGLLEEAAPEDVVAELLPELPPHAQADLVAGLWRVEHPAVTDLLTTLSDHHPEPDVAKAARKAAFKARSRL